MISSLIYNEFDNLYEIVRSSKPITVGYRGKVYRIRVSYSDWYSLTSFSRWDDMGRPKRCQVVIEDTVSPINTECLDIIIPYIEQIIPYIRNCIIRKNLKPTDFYK